MPIEIDKVGTTEPMVIKRDRGRSVLSRNLLLRASTYDTARTFTVLPSHKTNKVYS